MILFFRRILGWEAAGGVAVLAMTALALAIGNSPLASWHTGFFNTDLRHAIDEGPMVLFFLVVALEIKRELVAGELSSMRQAALPVAAAAGGMLVPALIFLALNHDNPGSLRGWGIPTATDIAFSLAVLGLVRTRVPVALKVFLASLAIIDDLGAIIIISLFYSSQLDLSMLALAAAAVLGLAALNRFKAPLLAYWPLAIILWLCLMKSGVHATLAGVALGLAIPASRTGKVEHALKPLVDFIVVPLFVFANAAVPLADVTTAMLTDGLFLGVFLGLFAGKQIGVMGASWLLLRLSPARLPSGSNWRGFYGAAVLTGIGFTMSLFIGELAFRGDGGADAEVRLGVLAASAASAALGLLVLTFSPKVSQNGSSTA